MIKGLKICGVSDSVTLNFILNHNHKPTMIGFITNYEKKSSSSQSFGAASQFATEASFFGEHQGEIFYKQAKCTVYRIDVSSFRKPEFHPSFKDALRQLNKAAKEPTSRRSKDVLKASISEFRTHYTSSAWLGATLTTETRFASKSENKGERRRRQDCIEESFGKATGTGANVKEISVDVGLKGGSIGGRNNWRLESQLRQHVQQGGQRLP